MQPRTSRPALLESPHFWAGSDKITTEAPSSLIILNQQFLNWAAEMGGPVRRCFSILAGRRIQGCRRALFELSRRKEFVVFSLFFFPVYFRERVLTRKVRQPEDTSTVCHP